MKKTNPLPATEKRNLKSRNIDRLSTLQMVDLINDEDKQVAPAVHRQRRPIAAAIDLIVEHFKLGGRLFYVGAGTSGRLGVLDASECPPTFSVAPSLVQGIIAGGRRALVTAIEGAEDIPSDGADALKKKNIGPRDVVLGIAACGLTPFVRGALRYAVRRRAGTIFLTCSPESCDRVSADIIINPVVGPEVITGSTRLKAGTATKLVLNTLTSGAMIKLGKVYGNLMVDLKATNQKLRDRSVRIVREVTGLSRPRAKQLLDRAAGRVKAALVMHFRDVDLARALDILEENNQLLRRAIAEKKCKPDRRR